MTDMADSLLNVYQENYSIAFMSVLASVAGFELQVGTRSLDNSGVDATIRACSISPETEREPALDVQIKGCRQHDLLRENHLAYQLKVPDYRRLIKQYYLPRCLAVVIVPRVLTEYIREMANLNEIPETHVLMRGTAYWACYTGHRDETVPGQDKVTVHLPRTQVLTVESLTEIMSKLDRGEALQ